MAIRIEDDTDNNGRGWKPVDETELTDLIQMVLRIAAQPVKNRYAKAADPARLEAERTLAKALANRLGHFAIFGPARSPKWHSAGGVLSDEPKV